MRYYSPWTIVRGMQRLVDAWGKQWTLDWMPPPTVISFSWMLGASTTSLHANDHSRGPGHHHYQSRIKTRPLDYRNTGTVRRDMAYDAWNIYSWCLIDRSPWPMYGYCEETRLGKCLPTNLFLTPYGSKPLGYLWGYQIVHVVWQIYSWYPMDQSP